MVQQTSRPAPGFVQNPDKRIDIVPHDREVTVRTGEIILAATNRAKRLEEEGLPPVLYIPFEDIHFANLQPTGTKTHCPYKGDASYWRLADGVLQGDVMWAYESPYDEMIAIKGHGAFYADRVTVKEGEGG